MSSSLAGGYVSADGHVVEPAELWTSRMEARFRDRAPHIETRKSIDFYVVDGLDPVAVGLDGAALESKIAGRVESPVARHADTRPGASDPRQRLKDQDLDHLRAEVIYPGQWSLMFYRIADAAYQHAAVRVYNDWLSEFCSYAPQRLLGAAILPMQGPLEWAAEEAERAATLGLKAVMIPAAVPAKPYIHPDYEPLWERLEEIGLPAVAHSGTAADIGASTVAKARKNGPGMAFMDEKAFQPMNALTELIWSGAPQRHPRLKFIISEGGIGWIACILRLMDHWWEDHHRWMQPRLDAPPSSYFKRQFWATFEDDRAGILTRELMGVDRLTWGADYPHTEGTFPKSQRQIAQDFVGVPEDEVYQMVIGNAATLFGLEV